MRYQSIWLDCSIHLGKLLSTTLLILSTTLEECTYIVNGSDTFGGDDSMHDLSNLGEPCIISQHVAVTKNWYGYIARFRMRSHGAKFYYHITYPEEDCCMKLLLYLEPQVDMLRYHMSCLQMQSVLDPTSPQVITLSPNSPTSGCRVNVTQTGDRVIDCVSGRILSSDIERNWYAAISSCGSPDGLQFSYSLYVYGWVESVESDCPSETYLSSANAIISYKKHHLTVLSELSIYMLGLFTSIVIHVNT